MSDNFHSIRHCRGRGSATLISTPYEGGRVVECDLVQCSHCAYQRKWVPGSGRKWGWCGRCHGFLCGRPACNARGCVTMEQELDLIERGVQWGDIRQELVPVKILVPAAPPK